MKRRFLSLPEREGLAIPAQVNYVGKGCNVAEHGFVFTGAAQAVNKLIRTGYLWEKVRVQGGAYGAFCLMDRIAGSLSFVSYRDPNVEATIKAFDDTAEYLENITINNDELEKSIIGAIGEMDSYWVELHNPGTEAINISGWEFKDEDDSHIFIIPDDTILEAGEYLVLSNDLEAFNTLFPSVSNVVGELGFGLSGSGELIRLYDAEETLVDAVEYGDDSPWPEEADGNGATLELIDPNLDNSLASSWIASLNNGTPGEQNDAAVPSEDDEIVSQQLALSNYPNPFNPETTIAFSVTDESTLSKIIVFNTKGQVVTVLLDEMLPCGEHTVVWDGRDDSGNSVSSGLYFYRLSSGDKQKTQKMILMK